MIARGARFQNWSAVLAANSVDQRMAISIAMRI
jgi:hypothetical protein